jgi:hypothetical protein|uniref:Uncharacterized protein n=1 Tax=viral metagenome TaxID=1070528 RepID=A0A6C0ALS1_9ZZZZ
MTIIINSEVLSELINSEQLKIVKKRQQHSDNFNYYFSPSIGLNLWKPKVMIINPKFIVLEFNKIEHMSLLILLRDINKKLQKLVKNKNSELFNTDIYNIMSEIDNDKFTIRCYLPNFKGKHLIKCYVDKNEEMFKLPRVNTVIDNCIIEIRNIWKTNDKSGFNIELKSTSYFFKSNE